MLSCFVLFNFGTVVFFFFNAFYPFSLSLSFSFVSARSRRTLIQEFWCSNFIFFLYFSYFLFVVTVILFSGRFLPIYFLALLLNLIYISWNSVFIFRMITFDAKYLVLKIEKYLFFSQKLGLYPGGPNR